MSRIWKIRKAVTTVPWYIHLIFSLFAGLFILLAVFSSFWMILLFSALAAASLGAWGCFLLTPLKFYSRVMHEVRGGLIFCEEPLDQRELGMLENEISWAYDKLRVMSSSYVDLPQFRKRTEGLAIFLLEDMSEATFEDAFHCSFRDLYVHLGDRFIIAYRSPGRGMEVRKKLLSWLCKKLAEDLYVDKQVRDALRGHLTD